MNKFSEFIKSNSPCLDCRNVPNHIIKQFENKLPEVLLQHWKESGWCGYAKGLIWTVNPLEFEDFVNEWANICHPSSIVFGRTAFGNLFIWSEQGVDFLSVHYNRLMTINKDIEDFFEFALCDKRFLRDGLMGTIFAKALPKLGPLKSDECYAFVPALALGGPGTVDSLQKVKLYEHLVILSQLQ